VAAVSPARKLDVALACVTRTMAIITAIALKTPHVSYGFQFLFEMIDPPYVCWIFVA
jgi:hypothetical protein